LNEYLPSGVRGCGFRHEIVEKVLRGVCEIARAYRQAVAYRLRAAPAAQLQPPPAPYEGGDMRVFAFIAASPERPPP
jgi:hypothetical protein